MQCAVVLRVGVTIKQINPLGTNVSRIKNVHPVFFRNFIYIDAIKITPTS